MPIQFPPIFSRNPWDTIKIFGNAINGIIRDEEMPERWEDLLVPTVALRLPPTTGPGTIPDPEFNTAECAVEFAVGNGPVFGVLNLPHTYKLATAIVPHMDVYCISAIASVGVSLSVWKLEWTWYNAAAVRSASWNVLTKTFTHNLTLRTGDGFTFGSVTGSVTMSFDSTIKFRLTRLSAGAGDTLPANVFLDNFGVRYRKDINRGSELETVKWP